MIGEQPHHQCKTVGIDAGCPGVEYVPAAGVESGSVYDGVLVARRLIPVGVVQAVIVFVVPDVGPGCLDVSHIGCQL